jgi:ATP-dependent Clp protease adaptor protein ClpS
MPDITVLPEIESEIRQKLCPRYAILLHNDDHNSMDFVVQVLNRVFNYPIDKCIEHMVEAHHKGKSVVWVGTLEVAELKADQMIAYGPDPNSTSSKCEPLRVTIEPVD